MSKHTPDSAARAIRALSQSGRIAKIASTWADYFDRQAGRGSWLTAYEAALLVREQAGCTFRQASRAVERQIGELTSDFFTCLPADWELLDRTCRA